ncbi:MAG: DUF2855 family protein [Cytophagales bacterium]|nr:MAG: DUF2855 family protein [Cytophagales bacterium]
MLENRIFRVQKNNLHQSELISSPIADAAALKTGEVLMKIDQFAFTANNITYGIIGDKFGYWQFFPTSDAEWGIIPVWGFADVVASQNDQIKVGERFYGYYPMASYCILESDKVKPNGFQDTSAHRSMLAPVYNYYINTQHDPSYQKAQEAFQMLMRPLFLTSFLIDVFLAEKDFFSAKHIILTSASSKTAFSLAALLKKRQQEHHSPYKIVGITSNNNLAFVEKLNLYDEVISYDALSEKQFEASCIVDFAGNHKLLYQLQQRLQDLIRYTCFVGMVHWEQRQGQAGEKVIGELFFAPQHAMNYNKAWGQEVFQQRSGEAWHFFSQHYGNTLEVELVKEETRLKTMYEETLMGKLSPQKGIVVAM